MLAEERRMQLAEWSRNEGRVDAVNAAARLKVAVETVRRDLEILQKQGILRRVHGGAIAIDRFGHEATFPERRKKNPGVKAQIAAAAAAFIPSEGCIFVDGGTTTDALAKHLQNLPDLLVVTTSLTLAAKIVESGTQVVVLGGPVRSTSLSVIGHQAATELEKFHAEVSFLGANGITLDAGMTTANQDEAVVKRAMIKHSAERIVLADHSKFGTSYSAKFATLTDIDRIVTDADTSKDFLDALGLADTEVVIAN